MKKYSNIIIIIIWHNFHARIDTFICMHVSHPYRPADQSLLQGNKMSPSSMCIAFTSNPHQGIAILHKHFMLLYSFYSFFHSFYKYRWRAETLKNVQHPSKCKYAITLHVWSFSVVMIFNTRTQIEIEHITNHYIYIYIYRRIIWEKQTQTIIFQQEF